MTKKEKLLKKKLLKSKLLQGLGLIALGLIAGAIESTLKGDWMVYFFLPIFMGVVLLLFSIFITLIYYKFFNKDVDVYVDGNFPFLHNANDSIESGEFEDGEFVGGGATSRWGDSDSTEIDTDTDTDIDIDLDLD